MNWSLLANSETRLPLAGWFVSGFLTSLLGALLPAWGYHLSGENLTAGSYFLVLVAGLVAATFLVRRGFLALPMRSVLTVGCALACGALAGVAVIPPGAATGWRVAGLFLLGGAAGLVNTGLFDAVQGAYRQDAAETLNLAGAFLGSGCIAAALLVGLMFSSYPAAAILLIAALMPLVFGIVFWRARYGETLRPEQSGTIDVMSQVRSLGAILFALLLFFQFGNEWAIAGWLPLFLIDRLGISPGRALYLLAAYWAALTGGRVLAFYWINRFRTGRLLFSSAALALFGCLILIMTDNLFGAIMGILFIGFGFAPIYPLTAARIGRRFPSYHPGFFNGIFSLGLLGGMLAPAQLGFWTQQFGIRAVMIIPAIGTCMVVALLLVLWLETKVTGR